MFSNFEPSTFSMIADNYNIINPSNEISSNYTLKEHKYNISIDSDYDVNNIQNIILKDTSMYVFEGNVILNDISIHNNISCTTIVVKYLYPV